MLNRNLDKNIRKAIKKRGFKLLTFSSKYLGGMHYNTFNHRLKHGSFHVSHLIECMELLGISFDELIQDPKDLRIKNTVPDKIEGIIKVEMPDYPKDVLNEPVPKEGFTVEMEGTEAKLVIKKQVNHGYNDALDLIKSLTV